MLKNNNYIVIPAWAVTHLGLKGNALLVYSIIHGFSQDENSCFHGSLEYLQEWTNSTRQGIINTLKNLIKDDLIKKEKNFPNNNYYINIEKIPNCKLSLQGSKKSLQNIIDNNIDNISISKDIDILDNTSTTTDTLEKENNYTKNMSMQEDIRQIVEYLNSVCGTHFKSTSSGTKKHIKARIKEGYTFNDFKDVIDYKWNEWGVKPIKFSTGQMSDTYLRPSTLFGSHFEEYLQAAWKQEFKQNITVKSEEKLSQRSNLVF